MFPFGEEGQRREVKVKPTRHNDTYCYSLLSLGSFITRVTLRLKWGGGGKMRRDRTTVPHNLQIKPTQCSGGGGQLTGVPIGPEAPADPSAPGIPSIPGGPCDPGVPSRPWERGREGEEGGVKERGE